MRERPDDSVALLLGQLLQNRHRLEQPKILRPRQQVSQWTHESVKRGTVDGVELDLIHGRGCVFQRLVEEQGALTEEVTLLKGVQECAVAGGEVHLALGDNVQVAANLSRSLDHSSGLISHHFQRLRHAHALVVAQTGQQRHLLQNVQQGRRLQLRRTMNGGAELITTQSPQDARGFGDDGRRSRMAKHEGQLTETLARLCDIHNDAVANDNIVLASLNDIEVIAKVALLHNLVTGGDSH
mmetsp:Transcript_19634/g.45907  ORF Transcript_19634/g.45907 Transcript_19634/m.45907 type:complete len:240 (-) Transcript_19634:3518-4237(-)